MTILIHLGSWHALALCCDFNEFMWVRVRQTGTETTGNQGSGRVDEILGAVWFQMYRKMRPQTGPFVIAMDERD